MSEEECSSELLFTSSRSLLLLLGLEQQIDPGLMVLSSVCGLMCGALAGCLVLYYCIRPFIINRQGRNIRRLLEPDNADLESNIPSVAESTERNEEKHTNKRSPVLSNKDQIPPVVSGDIAAFATRAKVIYPINQKYRPLADGASNPSLNKASSVTPLPADPPSSPSSSSSSSDEDGDEEGEDCAGQEGGGHFVSSGLPQSLQNFTFRVVSDRGLTLTQTSVESRMNLFFLALRDIQQKYTELQEEKDQVFSLMLKTLFQTRFPKNKQESDFYKMILQSQEKELSEVSKPFSPSVSAPGQSDSDVSMEEIERSQKERLEHGLHKCKMFSQQVEDLSELLLRQRNLFHPEEAQEIVSSIFKNLLQLEKRLQTKQDQFITEIQQKLVQWEELWFFLQTQPLLLRKEVSLRETLVSSTLEQKISDSLVTFSHMEKILREVQEVQSRALEQHHQECIQKTSAVIEMKDRQESKRRKMLKKQSKERKALEQQQSDLERVLKVHEDLTLKHQQQLKDLETQEEKRLTEALTELWMGLRSSYSSLMSDQCRTILSSLSSSTLTERLSTDLDQTLSSQLCEVQSSIRVQLEETLLRLQRETRAWTEEKVLVELNLQHLRELQTDSLQELELRQSFILNNQVCRLLALKQLHLWASLQRLFMVRHVSLKLLKEMRLCKLNALFEIDCGSERGGEKTGERGDAVKLSEEKHFLELSVKQEFLSELESGAELLQRHLQTITGNALSQSLQQEMESETERRTERETTELNPGSQDQEMKARLTEAASESVYLTKDSLSTLIQKYYSKLQSLTGRLQQEPAPLSDDEDQPEQNSAQILMSLIRDLQNWSRKPTSAEFQHRVELHKQQLMFQTNREHNKEWEKVRYRKINRDIELDRVKDQLMEAEESFIEELTALARVSLNKEESRNEGENDIGSQPVNIQDLLALNPGLDPAINPSLTPLVSAPVKIVLRDPKKTK